MPSPVSALGTPGNLIAAGTTLAPGKTIAAFLDLSTCVQGDITCELVTGGTAPTATTTFAAYKANGNVTPITLSSGAGAGAASLSVGSKTGLSVGQVVAIQQAGGNFTTPKPGELVTIASAITGSGPYTVPLVGTTINAYSSGDLVLLIANQGLFPVSPATTAGGWAINKDYSGPMSLSTGQWVVAATNNDLSATVTVLATYDKIPGFA